MMQFVQRFSQFNPLNAELNPICHLLALLGAHHILHVRRLKVKISMCPRVSTGRVCKRATGGDEVNRHCM